MFFKQSSVSYRVKKSRVGKKLKNHTGLLFVIAVGLLALILTVIWGNLWGEAAQKSAQERAAARQAAQWRAAQVPEWLPAQPDAVNAVYLGRITTEDAAIAAVQALLGTEEEEDAAAAAESGIGGTRALSVPLYDDGAPMYDSAVAQALGRQIAGTCDVTLSRLFAAILAQDGYIAATFTCQWQTVPAVETGLRRTMRAYEGALVAEIAQSGADEVLLLGLELNGENADEAAEFLREIRINCPEAVIGVGVSCEVMLSEYSVETAQKLLTWADFLALDLSDYGTHQVRVENEGEGEDGGEGMGEDEGMGEGENEAHSSEIRYTSASLAQVLSLLEPAIARCRMRLLLPTAMYEKLEQIEELGYRNWQIIR